MRNKMNDMSIKQLLKFFAVITLIIAVFIVGAYLFLRWAVNVEAPIEKPGKAPSPVETPSGAVLTPQVIYDGQTFQPSRVLRDGSGSIGCIVVLINRSALPLHIGLNPHNSAGDPGPNYPIIAPGDKLQFDPRFIGIKGLSLHNHDNPQQEFFIEFGPKCQL